MIKNDYPINVVRMNPLINKVEGRIKILKKLHVQNGRANTCRENAKVFSFYLPLALCFSNGLRNTKFKRRGEENKTTKSIRQMAT